MDARCTLAPSSNSRSERLAGTSCGAFLRVASCFQQSGSHCLFSLFAFEFGQPFRHLFRSEAFEIVFSAGGEGLQCSATWVLARHRCLCRARNSLPRVNRGGLCTGFRAGCLLREPRLNRSGSRHRGKRWLRGATVKSIPFSSHLHEVEQSADLNLKPMALFETSDDLRVRSGRSRSSQVNNLCFEGSELRSIGHGAFHGKLQASQSTTHSAGSNGIRTSFEGYSSHQSTVMGEIEKTSNAFDLYSMFTMR